MFADSTSLLREQSRQKPAICLLAELATESFENQGILVWKWIGENHRGLKVGSAYGLDVRM